MAAHGHHQLGLWRAARVHRTKCAGRRAAFVPGADRPRKVGRFNLLETERAAEMATRLGVRRLFSLAARSPLSVFTKQCPPPFALRAAFLTPRVAVEAFRETF